MGLTIHYTLQSPLTESVEVRTLVDTLRQHARDLPFKEVGELREFTGREADFMNSDSEDPARWLKIQAGGWVEDGSSHFEVKPLHIIGFSTWPGDGCEEANFGLCRYPALVTVQLHDGRKRRYPTNLAGWRWSSFCKTQYASHPDCGGLQNFLRCHLCVVKLLDFAKAMELMTIEVRDEGGYWEARSVEKLAREVGQWNEFAAAVSGMVADMAEAVGITSESAIAGFPAFEHLEAKGRQRLEELRGSATREEGDDARFHFRNDEQLCPAAGAAVGSRNPGSIRLRG